MQEAIKVFVGLDVHKDSIAIGAAEPGRAPAALIGRVAHDVNKLLKTLAKLGRAEEVHVVYEAGPTGYGLQRALAKRGYVCEVIAPSQIPRRAGERIKTDRRDCLRLAECSRAGELRAVWIPDLEDEAIRDLARAREDAVHSRTQARQQLKGFLLRHDVSYPGKTSWTKSFHVWLGTLNFGPASAQTAFTEYQLAVQAADERVERLTHALAQSIHGWRFEPVVASLQALRGVDVVTAIGLVAEIGDLARFEHPRKLMGYLGLYPAKRPAASASRAARSQRPATAMRGGCSSRRLGTTTAASPGSANGPSSANTRWTHTHPAKDRRLAWADEAESARPSVAAPH